MINALTVFQFEEQREIRTVIDESGAAWFVAADVCKALGIGNSRMAVSRLDDDQKRDDVSLTDTLGRPQKPTLVNESGLYELIIRSDKAEAKRFRKWVTSEVLPAIRKTGRYEGKALSPAEQLLANAQLLVEHERRLGRVEEMNRLIIDGLIGWGKLNEIRASDEAIREDIEERGKRR